MKKVIISLKNIVKNYKNKSVLDNISFDIYEGDRIALLGSNGSGKSTLSEIIAKVKEPSSGKIEYDPNIKLGIQFQESNYPYGITPEILVNFYMDRFSVKHLDQQKLDQMIDMFHLRGLMKKSISTMSGGQKQRLNIMLSIIHEPNFLILDELSTGLDIRIRHQMRHYVNDFLTTHPDCALLIVTHNTVEAETMCNRIIVLNQGKIWQDLPKSTIIEQYGSIDRYINHIFENEIYGANVTTNKQSSEKPWWKFWKKKEEFNESDF